MPDVGARTATSPAEVGTTGSVPDAKQQAFVREVLPHLDVLYRFSLSLTNDRTRAEDLVQETMLKAYRNWHRYRPNTNARSWLIRILRNAFVSEYRKIRREQAFFDRQLTANRFADSPSVAETDPEAAFLERIDDGEIRRAIDRLPNAYRITLVLSDLEDLSYAEIARITGVPTGTVKSRLFRARRALQQQLYDSAVSNGYVQARTAS